MSEAFPNFINRGVSGDADTKTMQSASFALRNNTIVGVLRSKNEEEESEVEIEYPDLDAFMEEVKQHQESGILGGMCPYSDLFFTTPEKDVFDWSKVPETTTSVIMEHQRDAVNVAVSKHGGRSIIALAPGLGKTMIGSLFATHYGKKVLIVCPASKVIDWRMEYKQWTGRSLSGVYVRSFDAVKTSLKLLEMDCDCVVVDECHKLKGMTDRSEAILPLLARVKAVILLSGTPQENRPCELFNQLKAIKPDLFTSRMTFSARYAEGKIGSRGVWEERGASHVEELAAIMHVSMYRREDISVVDLPIHRSLIYVNPTTQQNAVLSQLEARRLALVAAEAAAQTPVQKQRIGVARNVHANKMWRTSGEYKAEVCLERIKRIIDSHEDEKVIVFCFHLKHAAKVKDFLDPIGETVLVTGSTPAEKRQTLLQGLRDPSNSTRFGVLTISAIGEGINLAPGVSVVIFLEMDRVPAKMKQAEKRAHRKGAVKQVSTYWMMLEQSCDDANLAKLQDKEVVNSSVLGGKEEMFVFDHTEHPLEPPPKPEVTAKRAKRAPAAPRVKRVKEEVAVSVRDE